jgi:uncharacterized alkaline shock family protein YloU
MNSASSGSGSDSNAGREAADQRQAGDRTQARTTQAPSTQAPSTQAPSTQAAGAQARPRQAPTRPEARPMGTGVSLTTETGNTRIGEGVVAKIAGLAARDIPGVFSMGSGMARRVGQLRSLIPGGSEAVNQGVSVEVGEREAAIDLNVVTWYGQSIVEIAEAVRRNVIGQVEGMTGLRVVEVNVQIDDIYVETPEDSQGNQPQRVQ